MLGHRVSVVAQRVKSQPIMPASQMGTRSNPATPLPRQLPDSMPGKAAEDGHVPARPPDRVLRPWLWPGQVQATVAI